MSAVAKAKRIAASLACWSGPVDPQLLTGGLTNLNFVVEDGGMRFVVRVADDIPIHGIMRFNELAARRAANLSAYCRLVPAGCQVRRSFPVTGSKPS